MRATSFPSSLWRQHHVAPSYPSLEKSVSADVVVVGAGIAGLVCAYELQKNGKQVIVIEALEVGRGTTGHTTAKCSVQHGPIYQRLLRTFRPEIARSYYDFNMDALAYIREQAESGFAIDFETRDSYLYTTEASNDTLANELEAYEQLAIRGEDATDESKRDLPFAIHQSIVIRDQAQFHPVKYLSELASRFVEAGGTIYEQTRARSVSGGPRPILETSTGRRVQANDVVIATHYPFNDLKGLYVSRFQVERSYIVAAKATRPVPNGMYLSVDESSRSFRTYRDREDTYVLVGGEGHTSGQVTDTEERYARLEQFSSDQFQTHESAFHWSSQDLYTLDDLPYIGQMFSREPSIYIAAGFLKWGMTNGVGAGRLISDLILERPNRYKDVFHPSRPSLNRKAAKQFIKTNADTAVQFMKGKIERPRSLEDLAEDEGGIVHYEGKKVGVYKDREKNCHVVSKTCTHLGCDVAWNRAERSWDCPCHGSRFDAHGQVIEGPATTPLSYRYVASEQKE